MEEITIKLVIKIENKTIALKDFYDVLMEENIDNVIKFISLLSENTIIDDYLSSFFNNQKYTEEEIIKKYGEFEGSILVSYALIKNLLEEETIDYKDIDVKELSALNLFFKDIANLPILSKEENLKYVKRYQESKKLGNNTLCEYYRNLIVEGNIRLVIYVARKSANSKTPLEDLISEGFFGLAKAIEHYDFNYDCAFSTYAVFWIRQKIMRSVYKNGRSIKIPEHVQMKYNKYFLIKTKLSNKLGRNATNEEIAIAMGEKIETIDTLIESFKDVTSLDSKLSDDSETDKYNFIENKSSSFENDVINRETVLKLMSCLNEKEKDVILKRYIQDYTLDAVGKMYRITRERVRQIENRALLKMRNFSNMNVTLNVKNESELILDGKTLKEVIGEIKANSFNSYFRKNSKLKTIYFKAFGENLDKVYDDSNLEKREIYVLRASIKKIIKTNNVGIGKKYDNKTLEEIFKLASDMTDDDIKEVKNKWWRKSLLNNGNCMDVLVKAFGVDGNEPCNLSVLNFEEKIKLRSKLDYWVIRLSEEVKKKNKKTYTYRRLNEILELSYDDTVYFVSTLDKKSSLYKMIILVFGNDLKGYLNKNELEKETYTKLVSNLSTMKKIINDKNIYKNKYLIDIVNTNLSDIKTFVSEEEMTILKKAFGEKLDRRFINTVSVRVLTKVINHINKKIKEVELKMEKETKTNKGKKSVYKNKTLDKILGISYEEVLSIFNKGRKDTTIYKIFVKAFGEDLKGVFNTNNLNTNEKLMLYNKVNTLKKQIGIKKGKKSMYENMTLDKILGISYEEVLSIFNTGRKDTTIYKVFVKAFGEDLKGIFNTSNLDKTEKILLYNKINVLKSKKDSIKEDKDLNKYYMCIISLMPKEYKTILSLYFENYSLEKIANLMDLNINDVNNKLKEGISFMQEIISLYNKTFNEKLDENEKMLR